MISCVFQPSARKENGKRAGLLDLALSSFLDALACGVVIVLEGYRRHQYSTVAVVQDKVDISIFLYFYISTVFHISMFALDMSFARWSSGLCNVDWQSGTGAVDA